MQTELADAPHYNKTASTEVRTGRRRFSAEYKQRILAEAAACKRGEVGMMLRREGLYASTLVAWRKQQRAAGNNALMPQKRGRKGETPRAEQARLMRELARTKEKLRQAEAIIDIQKKLCMMLGLPVADEVP